MWPARGDFSLAAARHWPVRGLYRSAVSTGAPALRPPATSTSPHGRSVAVCSERGSRRSPVAVHLSVGGSYRSADRSLPSADPATSTWPFTSVVAVWRVRVVLIVFEVVVHDGDSGSKTKPAFTPGPPAISTLPVFSSVAVASTGAAGNCGAAIHAGSSTSSSSALSSGVPSSIPPATSTRPSGIIVAECEWRFAPMFGPVVHSSLLGS